MFKIRTFCISLLIIFFYTGCGENQQSKQSNESEKTTIKFVLNEGKKWQMDEHTRNAIKNLANVLKSNEQIESIEDHKLLGEKLDEELVLLIRGCTMEGPAHDQLHVFLGEFYPAVQNLKKEKNLDSSVNILEKIKNLLVEYDKYFE